MKYVLDYLCFLINHAPHHRTNIQIIKSTVYSQSIP